MERRARRKPADPPRPSPRARLEVDARRAQLLALGLRIFSERAYDDVSIDDIARAAGVSKGLLYHYFPTKRDFYVAALGEAAAQLLAETNTAHDPAAPPEAQARAGLETYLSFVERHAPAYVALMRGGIGSDPEVAAILEETRATFVARILAQAPGPAGAPLLRTALRGWIGFVEATALDWVAERGVRREDLVALLVGVLLDAVRAAAALAPDAPPG